MYNNMSILVYVCQVWLPLIFLSLGLLPPDSNGQRDWKYESKDLEYKQSRSHTEYDHKVAVHKVTSLFQTTGPVYADQVTTLHAIKVVTPAYFVK